MSTFNSMLIVFVLLGMLGRGYTVDWTVTTPLDEYVNRADNTFNYKPLYVQPFLNFTLHMYNLTSQTWMDDKYSSQPIWWHYLSIFIPRKPKIFDAGYLVIGNGTVDDPMPTMSSGDDHQFMKRTANFTVTLGVVSAYLRMVPFEPIFFNDTSTAHYADAVIAHTWRNYIEQPETAVPEMFALMPMTKAAKVAADAMVERAHFFDNRFQITKYMPTGYSKRGWTTWLLASVDRRCFAIAPTVYDNLNMNQNMEHHFRSMGGWTWAYQPYWVEKVNYYLYDPRMYEMLQFMDPISFNERLTMPKHLFQATGDEFFLPDGSHYFFDDITAPKFIRIFENDNHSLYLHWDERDNNLQAFFLTAYSNLTFPVFDWTRTENATHGSIFVNSSVDVLDVRCWTADNSNRTCPEGVCRRDFRYMALDGPTGTAWYQCPYTHIGASSYSATLPKRDDNGFRAFYLELTVAGPESYLFTVTTEVHIIPDKFPFEKCNTNEECEGVLV